MAQKRKTIKITETMKVGALLENLDGKVDLVLEQFVDVKKTLDVHTKTLNIHTKQLDTLNTKMDFVMDHKADKKELHQLERRVIALKGA